MTRKLVFTEGCPNECSYCYEKPKMKYYNPEFYFYEDYIQILDMNFLANPRAKDILNELTLANKSYELVCGVDFRRLDLETCKLMKRANFIKVRWAWDYGFSQQKIHQNVVRMFKKAKYQSEQLSVFILVNWKIPYTECLQKLDLLKIWNVKVNDCCWDGGYKKAKPKHWSIEQIKDFRKKCRKHNQLVRFRIDPELKSTEPYNKKDSLMKFLK